MYASRVTQLIVGLFALLGIVALAILSIRLGRISLLPTPGYVLFADFDNIAGLKGGDDVDIAGVKVGQVIGATLKENQAQVAMRIDKGVDIDSDAIASIKSSGIIGGKYVSIQLGPSEITLHNGGRIRQTESAFVLENAIGQFINNIGSRPDNQKGGESNGGADNPTRKEPSDQKK